jgi:hypothetical protein
VVVWRRLNGRLPFLLQRRCPRLTAPPPTSRLMPPPPPPLLPRSHRAQTVYGELSEPDRLADPRPGGREVAAYLEAEGVVPRGGVPGPGGSGASAGSGGGRSAAEAAALPLLGPLTSTYLHSSYPAPGAAGRAAGQPAVAWAPPVERQTLAGAAAALGPRPTSGPLKLPQSAAAATATTGASGAASATASQPPAWAHEVDTDLQFGQ